MKRVEQVNTERLNASSLSYVLAQDNEENLEELQEHLRVSGIGSVGLAEIRDRVKSIREEREKLKRDRERIARLFAPDKKNRVYRYGSAFCPECHMFKNYEKECPYCKHLEMTW